MTRRRPLVRWWRRVRRPSLPRLVVGSLAVHLAVLTLAAWWLASPGPPPPSREPLVVELPPAEPGRPLVQPEASSPSRPAPREAAPRPAPAPRTSAPPIPAAPREAPPVSAPAVPTAPPAPPVVARAPEPAPVPAPPLPAPPAPATPEPAPAPTAPGPVARAVPDAPAASAVAPPAEPPAAGPSESPLLGRGFSLLRPQIDVPPLPRLSRGGGTQGEGDGAGEAGRYREGGPAIPLDKPPDADYAEYFLKVKRAIEDHWSYPRAAAEKGQSGQLVLEFLIRKDGNVLVELVRSSGVDILDRYALTAVKLAAPFPPLPQQMRTESLRVSANFTYILDHGFRLFGLK